MKDDSDTDTALVPVKVNADLTEAINQAVTEAIRSFQEDGGKDASRSAWSLIRKGLDCLSIPFDVILAGKDGVARIAERVTTVPEDKRRPVPPQIAGPAIEGMKFLPLTDPLFAMYAELLAAASDVTRLDEVHPRFAKLLGMLSPREAFLLDWISKNDSPHLATKTEEFSVDRNGERTRHYSAVMPSTSLRTVIPGNVTAIVESLEALGLVQWVLHIERGGTPDGAGGLSDVERLHQLTISQLGRSLCAACVPPEGVQLKDPA